MKLRYVALNIDHPLYSGFSDEQFIFEFNKNTEFIRNYISKAIRKYYYVTDGTFNMLCINLCTDKGGCKILHSVATLEVRLIVSNAEVKEYLRLIDPIAKYEYYLEVLRRGYLMAQTLKPIPLKELLDIHQQFRDNGYRNEWLFKKVRLTAYNMTLLFNCYFTTEEFRLEMDAYDNKTKELITNGLIKKTFPDELCFAKSFKKIVVENNVLTILDFLAKPAFEMDLDKIRCGVFNVNDIEGLWNK